jgi:hypothetical protein
MGPMLSRPSPRLVDALDAGDIVRLLIAKGANVNVRLKRPIIGRHHTPTGDASLGEGTTPLARAAKSNDLQLMRILLDAGADPKLTLKDRHWRDVIAFAEGRRRRVRGGDSCDWKRVQIEAIVFRLIARGHQCAPHDGHDLRFMRRSWALSWWCILAEHGAKSTEETGTHAARHRPRRGRRRGGGRRAVAARLERQYTLSSRRRALHSRWRESPQ